jgi:hypothetical protein
VLPPQKNTRPDLPVAMPRAAAQAGFPAGQPGTGESIFSEYKSLLPLVQWRRGKKAERESNFAVACSGMDVSGMRRKTRPLCERRDQFDEYGREFHGVSLWRGRLRPWAQAGR